MCSKALGKKREKEKQREKLRLQCMGAELLGSKNHISHVIDSEDLSKAKVEYIRSVRIWVRGISEASTANLTS